MNLTRRAIAMTEATSKPRQLIVDFGSSDVIGYSWPGMKPVFEFKVGAGRSKIEAELKKSLKIGGEDDDDSPMGEILFNVEKPPRSTPSSGFKTYLMSIDGVDVSFEPAPTSAIRHIHSIDDNEDRKLSKIARQSTESTSFNMTSAVLDMIESSPDQDESQHGARDELVDAIDKLASLDPTFKKRLLYFKREFLVGSIPTGARLKQLEASAPRSDDLRLIKLPAYQDYAKKLDAYIKTLVGE